MSTIQTNNIDGMDASAADSVLYPSFRDQSVAFYSSLDTRLILKLQRKISIIKYRLPSYTKASKLELACRCKCPGRALFRHVGRCYSWFRREHLSGIIRDADQEIINDLSSLQLPDNEGIGSTLCLLAALTDCVLHLTKTRVDLLKMLLFQNGDTLLHRWIRMLVSHNSISRRAHQKIKDHSIIIQHYSTELLKNGIDPNHKNWSNESALTIVWQCPSIRLLCSDAFRSFHTGDDAHLSDTRLQLTDLILQHGSDPNGVSGKNHFTHLGVYMTSDMWKCSLGRGMLPDGFFFGIDSFCHHGADVNNILLVKNGSQITALTVFLGLQLRISQDGILQYMGQFCEKAPHHTRLVLNHLKPYDMCMNRASSQCILLFVRLLLQLCDFTDVDETIAHFKGFIFAGMNPGLFETNVGSLRFLFYQSSFEDVPSTYRDHADAILKILYQCLPQQKLNELIEINNLRPVTSRYLNSLKFPRNLMTLSRVAIYQSLDWEIQENILKLSLPKVLLDLVLQK